MGQNVYAYGNGLAQEVDLGGRNSFSPNGPDIDQLMENIQVALIEFLKPGSPASTTSVLMDTISEALEAAERIGRQGVVDYLKEGGYGIIVK